jgi:hypothetical protein
VRRSIAFVDLDFCRVKDKKTSNIGVSHLQ